MDTIYCNYYNTVIKREATNSFSFLCIIIDVLSVKDLYFFLINIDKGYCIMKEIIYPQRLKESVVGKGDLSYIRTSHHGAPPPPPPITCIPSKRDFINNPVNYNLVSKVDVNYEFYVIVEADGQRFFVRAAGNAVPTEPVIGNLSYDEDDDYDSAPEGDLTAAMAVDPFLNTYDISTSGFNEDYYSLEPYHPYARFLYRMWNRYDVKPVETPRESWSLTKLDGLTVSSTLPEDFAFEIDALDLRLNPDPYSFKFTHATADEMQKYGIVNNSSQRCINIIDYVNDGNELEAFSCAQIGLPTSSNYDNVSLISCVEAPSEYVFEIQDIHNLSDTSGTIQITDTGSGFTKKYLFKKIDDFLSRWLAIDMVRLDFPVYHSNAFLDGDQLVIMMEQLEGVPESYFNPLKIIIQMNSPNALFTNNGTNRLAFCLSVESITSDGTPPPPPPPTPEPEPTPSDPPPVINCIPTSFNMTQIQGDTTKGGNVIVVASIWYEGQEYPYITTGDPMAYMVANVDGNRLSFANGFSTGINLYDRVYNKFPEYGKALVLPRTRDDKFFIAGVGSNNLDKYVVSTLMWDGSLGDKSFKSDTMQIIESPSQIRLTKLSPEMTQFIKTYGGDTGVLLNGRYNVNNLVDMINQGNDIIVDACVKVESNIFNTTPAPPEEPPEVTTPPTPAMAIVNMISDTPFVSTFKNGFELESYYDAEAGGYRIENENNKVYLRDPAYAPVVSFRPKQGNLMGATQIQGEVYDWQGIGFDINLATPKHLNKIQNIYGFPSNDVVLVMLSQLNEEQSAPPILNGRFVCNPEIE